MDDKLLTEDLDDLASLLSLEVAADDHDFVVLADWEGANVVLLSELL